MGVGDVVGLVRQIGFAGLSIEGFDAGGIGNLEQLLEAKPTGKPLLAFVRMLDSCQALPLVFIELYPGEKKELILFDFPSPHIYIGDFTI